MHRWRDQAIALAFCFAEHRPLALLGSPSAAYWHPPDWDSPPYVFNLARVASSHGFSAEVTNAFTDTRLQVASRISVVTAHSRREGPGIPYFAAAPRRALDPAGMVTGTNPYGFLKSIPVQKMAYSSLMTKVFHGDLRSTAIRRFTKLFDVSPAQLTSLRWDNIGNQLRKCTKFVAMAFIKTLVNSWATSNHENPRLNCIFGCPAGNGCDDDLFHYLKCPALWGIICHTLYFHPPDMELPVTILLGLEAPDCLAEVSAPLVACLFNVYHFIKRGRHGVLGEAAVQADLITRSVKLKSVQGLPYISSSSGEWPPWKVQRRS